MLTQFLYTQALASTCMSFLSSQQRIQNPLVHCTYIVQSSGDQHVIEIGVNYIMRAGLTYMTLISGQDIK